MSKTGHTGLSGQATWLPHSRGVVGTQATPITKERIRSAWLDLGMSLSARRRELEFIQAELAARVGYSRSAIAGAETGQGRAHRALWEACDRELMAGGELLAEFLQVHGLVRAFDAQTERERQMRRNERARGLRNDIDQAGSAGLHHGTDGDILYGVSADEVHPLEAADTPELGGAAARPPLDRPSVDSSGSPTTLHITVSAGAEATVFVDGHGSAIRVVVSAAVGAGHELDGSATEGARVYLMDTRRRPR